MFRRSRLTALLLLVGGVGVCMGGLYYLAKREPDFYNRAPDPDGFETRERAAQLLTRVQDLKNEIRSRYEWGETFTAEDLNCFFVQNMGDKGGLASLLPEGVHSPRVAIDGDRLKIGFKYGAGFWSTVVWVELKVWLVKDEPNLVAVEVCDLRTGSLPVGSQSVLDSISESAREWNIDVTWYRNGSNPVGLFRFFANQVGQPSSQILTLEVKDGKIMVAGRSAPDQSPIAALGIPRQIHD
ncbi:MAG TPA: hypothetical protein VN641_21860 [Urbifossiella sp.]|jgi:hypothetical protein|nr:hypothetical protein [Urbifossiella sp.]